MMPFGVAIDSSGSVYVADTWNHRIQKFKGQWGIRRKMGKFWSGDGQFDWPYGIAIDWCNGNVYIADTYNDRIQKFTSDGTFIAKWERSGSGSVSSHCRRV